MAPDSFCVLVIRRYVIDHNSTFGGENLMKKLLAVLVCLMMVLSLFSCDTTDWKDEETATTNNQKDEESIATTGNQEDEDGTATKTDEKAEETTEAVDDPSSPLNDLAMQMFEAAIKGEISVCDAHLGETELKNLQFPSDGTRLEECKQLTKAILDMDGDGVNEYVIQSPDRDHIVLHCYNGKVYSYCFDRSVFYNLNTDGSFYWRGLSKPEGAHVGLNQLSFDGSLLIVKEVYKIIMDPAEMTPIAYYMDGKQITSDEYSVYYSNNPKRFASFCPFDISCEYPISSEDAFEIVSNHWRRKDGASEGACGTTLVYRIVILEKPNAYTMNYRICLQWEAYSHANHGWESQIPRITVLDELLVNAITGECLNIQEACPDGK